MSDLQQTFNVADLPKHIGEGGEALIIPDPERWPGRVLKLFLDPDEQGFTGEKRRRALEKLFEIQTKLDRFPKNVPVRVLVPLQTVRDPNGLPGRKIVGYLMQQVTGVTQLQEYSEKPYLESRRIDLGISFTDILNALILPVFRDLHHTVSRLHEHEARFVIGDFSDTNILVQGNIAYLCDADSFGFGQYPARLRKPEFSDPLLSEKNKEPSVESDWYAYTLLLFQTLLRIKPYEGKYIPKKTMKLSERIRQRITIFDDGVEIPKWGVSPWMLPDTLREHFQEVFGRADKRGPFPAHLLDMKWTQCPCGVLHAKEACPTCSTLWRSIGTVRYHFASLKDESAERRTEKGAIRTTRLFKREDCEILSVTHRSGQLRYVYAEKSAGYERKREDGSTTDILEAGMKLYHRSNVHGRFKPMCEYTVFEDVGTKDEKPYVVIEDPQDDVVKGFHAHKVKYNSQALYAMREGQYVSLDKRGKHRSSSPDAMELTKNWFLLGRRQIF